MLGWTANDASNHHFKITLPLTLRISGSMRMPLTYIIMWTILAQLSMSGAQTLVIRNAISVQVSRIYHHVVKLHSITVWVLLTIFVRPK